MECVVQCYSCKCSNLLERGNFCSRTPEFEQKAVVDLSLNVVFYNVLLGGRAPRFLSKGKNRLVIYAVPVSATHYGGTAVKALRSAARHEVACFSVVTALFLMESKCEIPVCVKFSDTA